MQSASIKLVIANISRPTVVLLTFLLTSLGFISIGNANELKQRIKEKILHQAEGLQTYLPMVVDDYQFHPSIFGTQMGVVTSDHVDKARTAGIDWVRFNAFDWRSIEPVRTDPPTYNWNEVDENALVEIASQGLRTIATIRYTPDWAQKIPGIPCGPVAEEKFDEFEEFLVALVTRYQQPPYNIHYWEIGNEPDVDPALVPPDSVFGCWGDDNDPYYGGGYYGQMLQTVYPAIKAADPHARVLVGGLLLDCDPLYPPPGKDCASANFLEGILQVGGGDYFDIVSFHGYANYDGSLQQDENFGNWAQRGGVVLGKINFIREILSNFSVNKPLMLTEGSLLCPENSPYCSPPGVDFFEAQANYVVWLYVRNWANNLLGTIWFPFEGEGWRFGGLYGSGDDPKPAYEALEFLTKELSAASYNREVSGYPDLRVYEFKMINKLVWVMWAVDEEPHLISLPAKYVKVFDIFGSDITPIVPAITVQSPIYVEFAP